MVERRGQTGRLRSVWFLKNRRELQWLLAGTTVPGRDLAGKTQTHTEGSPTLSLAVIESTGELGSPSTDLGSHLLWEPRAMISI